MCHLPRREPSDFPRFGLGGADRLPFPARIEGAHSDRAASASKKDGLAALPLTPLRPRIARAQKIIRLHPLLCSASRRTTRPPCPSFTWQGSARRPARLCFLFPRGGSSKAAYSVCRHG